MVIRTHSLEETYHLATTILDRLRPRPEGATVLALKGDLGAGKTSFTQGLAQALGIADVVTSPTFVIEKIYQVTGSPLWKRLIHIDAYRLSGGQDLLTLGFEAVLADPYNLIVLEWPERVADIIPANALVITCAFIDETTREIAYEI